MARGGIIIIILAYLIMMSAQLDDAMYFLLRRDISISIFVFWIFNSLVSDEAFPLNRLVCLHFHIGHDGIGNKKIVPKTPDKLL